MEKDKEIFDVDEDGVTEDQRRIHRLQWENDIFLEAHKQKLKTGFTRVPAKLILSDISADSLRVMIVLLGMKQYWGNSWGRNLELLQHFLPLTAQQLQEALSPEFYEAIEEFYEE